MRPLLLVGLLLHSHDVLLRLLRETSGCVDHLIVHIAVEPAGICRLFPDFCPKISLELVTNFLLFPVLCKVVVRVAELTEFLKLLQVFKDGKVLESFPNVFAHCLKFRKRQGN